MTVKSQYGVGLMCCVLEALVCLILVLWVVMPCGFLGNNVLEEHTISMARAEANLHQYVCMPLWPRRPVSAFFNFVFFQTI